jgi:uncharacterized protein YjiS (DUF1127 family)
MELVSALPQPRRVTSLWRPVETFVLWSRVRRMTMTLETLSDAALKDFGVSRCAIEGLANECYRSGSS